MSPFIPWTFMEFPLDMEHEISWQHVCIGLRPCLRIDRVEDIAEIMKDVETICHKNQITFQHRITQSGVPHEIIAIER